MSSLDEPALTEREREIRSSQIYLESIQSKPIIANKFQV